MSLKNVWRGVALLAAMTMLLAACTPAATETAAPEPTVEPTAAPPEPTAEPEQPLTFGMLLVCPYNDHGWSQAHYEAGLYVEENIPGATMVYLDKVNPADRPGTTPAQLAEDLVAQGAQLVIFNSDDMKDGATEFATKYPDIPVIHASGDVAWADGQNFLDLGNMVNVMPRMEDTKHIAGCAAAPTQVADDFYNSGFDVVISGIDTTEALVQARAATEAGNTVYNVAYDFEEGCNEAPEVCLGVAYFNWRPFYLRYLQAAMDGTFAPAFEWLGPDWTDINNLDTSYAGFERSQALSQEASTQLDGFIAELAGGLNLWSGPLNLQDGTAYLADGEVGTEQQVWYLPQLLEGMEGQSVSQ